MKPLPYQSFVFRSKAIPIALIIIVLAPGLLTSFTPYSKTYSISHQETSFRASLGGDEGDALRPNTVQKEVKKNEQNRQWVSGGGFGILQHLLRLRFSEELPHVSNTVLSNHSSLYIFLRVIRI